MEGCKLSYNTLVIQPLTFHEDQAFPSLCATPAVPLQSGDKKAFKCHLSFNKNTNIPNRLSFSFTWLIALVEFHAAFPSLPAPPLQVLPWWLVSWERICSQHMEMLLHQTLSSPLIKAPVEKIPSHSFRPPNPFPYPLLEIIPLPKLCSPKSTLHQKLCQSEELGNSQRHVQFG